MVETQNNHFGLHHNSLSVFHSYTPTYFGRLSAEFYKRKLLEVLHLLHAYINLQ